MTLRHRRLYLDMDMVFLTSFKQHMIECVELSLKVPCKTAMIWAYLGHMHRAIILSVTLGLHHDTKVDVIVFRKLNAQDLFCWELG